MTLTKRQLIKINLSLLFIYIFHRYIFNILLYLFGLFIIITILWAINTPGSINYICHGLQCIYNICIYILQGCPCRLTW